MILLTGVAGFIGMHVARRLLESGQAVLGVDSLGPHGAASAPQAARLAQLARVPGFSFLQADLAGTAAIEAVFARGPFEAVVHLAAQTGVRQSAADPHGCIMNNLVAFGNLIEHCRRHGVGHVVYASSSSAYGANRALPFSEHDPADHPVSLYAATKRSNELLAHSYSHLYGLPTTGLRFFTVYGPWGRPDMAPMLFADAISQGLPIEVFNGGDMLRDFTYIDDVVEAIVRVLAHPAEADPRFDGAHPDPASSYAPYRIYNVGNQRAVRLNDFIDALEAALGRRAERVASPMHGADMRATWADMHEFEQTLHWSPATPLATGIDRFARWYQRHHA
ncbi:MAG: NAD-dependent epimerase/dehydratase family protein [Massilia sp.]